MIPKKNYQSDLISITRLLGRIAIMDDSIDKKRRALIDGLAELIEASGWVWTIGRVDPERTTPMQMDMLSGGLSDKQLAGILDSPSDTTSRDPCDQPLAALVAKGKPFVRTRQQLTDDDTWYHSENVKVHFLRNNIDHCMYAITPHAAGFSGIGFFRGTNTPPFSERHTQIVKVITIQIPWLHNTAHTEKQGTSVEELTPRLRTVLPLLLDGYLCNQIATMLNLSPHTIKGYIRDIYRHFNVSSQLELIHNFRGK